METDEIYQESDDGENQQRGPKSTFIPLCIFDIKKMEKWMPEFSPPLEDVERPAVKEIESTKNQEEIERTIYKYKLFILFKKKPLSNYQQVVHSKGQLEAEEKWREWVEDLCVFDTPRGEIEEMIVRYRRSLKHMMRNPMLARLAKHKLQWLKDYCSIRNYCVDRTENKNEDSDDESEIDQVVNECKGMKKSKRISTSALFKNQKSLSRYDNTIEIKRMHEKMAEKRRKRFEKRVQKPEINLHEEKNKKLLVERKKVESYRKTSKKSSKKKKNSKAIEKKDENNRSYGRNIEVSSTIGNNNIPLSEEQKFEILKDVMIDSIQAEIKEIKRMDLIYLSWGDVLTRFNRPIDNLNRFMFNH